MIDAVATRRRTTNIVLAVLTWTLLFALVPAGAQANGLDICVNTTGCPAAQTVTTYEAAIDIANDDVERDTIHIGPGILEPSGGAFQFMTDTLVDVVGAGQDETTLRAPATAFYTMYMYTPGSSIRDLTIVHDDDAPYGLVLRDSTADRITVNASASRPVNNGKGVFMNAGTSTLRNSTVNMPLDGTHNDWALSVSNLATGGIVENVDLTGDNAIVTASQVTVSGSTLTGHRVFVVNNSGTATISNSVLRARAGSTPTPMGINNMSLGVVTSVTTRHVTIVGAGEGEGLRASKNCSSGGSSTITAINTTISGFPVSTAQEGCNTVASSSATTCPAPVVDTANVQLTYSHYDGTSIVDSGCLGRDNVRFGDPGFVSASDLRPRMPSPLIETGEPTADAGGETDITGAARVADGDGIGFARRDIGAHEYQRIAPAVTASVDPGAGALSQVFGFTAVGTDANGEALEYRWTFADGTTYDQASVAKSFVAAGAQSGQVVVTDASGLTATAAATATVAAPEVVTPPVVPPVVAATPDTAPPQVTVKGSSLVAVLAATRTGVITIQVGCPRSETSPCGLTLTAKSQRRISLGGARARIVVLGNAKASIAPGATSKVTIKLSKQALASLVRARTMPAIIQLVASDAAGNRATTTVRATIKAPRR